MNEATPLTFETWNKVISIFSLLSDECTVAIKEKHLKVTSLDELTQQQASNLVTCLNPLLSLAPLLSSAAQDSLEKAKKDEGASKGSPMSEINPSTITQIVISGQIDILAGEFINNNLDVSLFAR